MLKKKKKKLNMLNRRNKLLSYNEIFNFCKSEGLDPNELLDKDFENNNYHKEHPVNVLILPF
ncbi:MAG: hypothetical protein JXQ23_10310 [Clostridia bacterium]|nr:hypothetical protein [Clostridia bacterium]